MGQFLRHRVSILMELILKQSKSNIVLALDDWLKLLIYIYPWEIYTEM